MSFVVCLIPCFTRDIILHVNKGAFHFILQWGFFVSPFLSLVREAQHNHQVIKSRPCLLSFACCNDSLEKSQKKPNTLIQFAGTVHCTCCLKTQRNDTPPACLTLSLNPRLLFTQAFFNIIGIILKTFKCSMNLEFVNYYLLFKK